MTKYDPEYNHTYYVQHKKHRDYIVYKSSAKKFVRIATKEDLFELFHKIDERLDELKWLFTF